ncbi:hypothetical protein ACQ4PT_057721 [Festuca glaucescens]
MPVRKSSLPQSKKRQKRRLKQREEQAAAAHAVVVQAVLAAQKVALKKYELEQEAQRQVTAQQALLMMNQRAVDFALSAQQAAQSAGSQSSGALRPARSQSPPQYGFLPSNGSGVGATRFSPSPRSDSPEVAESFPSAGQAAAIDLNAPLEDSPSMHRAHVPRRTPEGKMLFGGVATDAGTSSAPNVFDETTVPPFQYLAYVDDSTMHDLINENDFLGVQNDEPEDYDESECSKFTAAYNGIVVRAQSGIGVNVQVAQAMGAFKAQNNGRSFTLVHAWLKLHGHPKWTELVAHLQLQNKNTGKAKSKKRSSDGGTIDLETTELDGGLGKRSDRPRGRKISKEDLKREASTLAFQKSLKELMSDKESSSGKRGEIRELKKDERFKSFMDTLQEKYRADALANAERLRIEAEKAEGAKIEATTKAKEVELKMFVEETRVMTQDLTILDDNTRAWYEKKQREIMARDM